MQITYFNLNSEVLGFQHDVNAASQTGLSPSAGTELMNQPSDRHPGLSGSHAMARTTLNYLLDAVVQWFLEKWVNSNLEINPTYWSFTDRPTLAVLCK